MAIPSTNNIRTMNWGILLFLRFTQQAIPVVYIDQLCWEGKRMIQNGRCWAREYSFVGKKAKQTECTKPSWEYGFPE